MPETRVIKKYPNRRLYDTEESRYIKLADVRALVLDDMDFVVIDKRTGSDITRSILLQVISEGEEPVEPIMSRGFLSHVIRAHGRMPAAGAAAYLEQCLDAYVKRQDGARPVAVADVAHVHRGPWAAPQDGGAQRHGFGDAGSRTVSQDRKKAG